jgi:hypothetical protein
MYDLFASCLSGVSSGLFSGTNQNHQNQSMQSQYMQNAALQNQSNNYQIQQPATSMWVYGSSTYAAEEMAFKKGIDIMCAMTGVNPDKFTNMCYNQIYYNPSVPTVYDDISVIVKSCVRRNERWIAMEGEIMRNPTASDYYEKFFNLTDDDTWQKRKLVRKIKDGE